MSRLLKVQNTCTIEQAQSLNKAIRENGLEWPGIEWEKGCRFHANWGWRLSSYTTIKGTIPAPNLGELAKMLVPKESVFNCECVSIPYFITQLLFEIQNKTETIKAHWATLC